MAQSLFLLYLALNGFYAFFYIGAMVDVYVTEYVVLRLHARGKVLVMVGLFLFALAVLLVPLSYAFCHLRVKVAVGIQEVQSLIHINNNVEKQFHATARGECSRNHRHAEQFAELGIVYVVATLLRLVKHVQGAHHTQVHVYELCGEIEVALQVARVDDVDYHVGRMLDNLLAYVEFFGRVCRKRICAGQVDDIELVALECGVSHLCVNGHARVVADTLVCSACKVEERGLAAIGVAHECHVYGASLLHGSIAKLRVGQRVRLLRFVAVVIVGFGWYSRLRSGVLLNCRRLFGRYNLNHFGL